MRLLLVLRERLARKNYRDLALRRALGSFAAILVGPGRSVLRRRQIAAKAPSPPRPHQDHHDIVRRAATSASTAAEIATASAIAGGPSGFQIVDDAGDALCRDPGTCANARWRRSSCAGRRNGRLPARPDITRSEAELILRPRVRSRRSGASAARIPVRPGPPSSGLFPRRS